MPKEAIFLIIILIFSVPAYGYLGADMPQEYPQEMPDSFFDSGIVQLPDSAKSFDQKDRYIVFGKNKNVYDSISKDLSYSITSQNGFFGVGVFKGDRLQNIDSDGVTVIKDFRVDLHQNNKVQDASRIKEITAAENVTATGKGVNIAIVDTGVDFSNPDMNHAVARDKSRHPIMIDADGQGIILTKAKFLAHIDDDGLLRNISKELPKNFTSKVYWNNDGVFLDLKQGGRGTDIPIYNSFYPQAGSNLIFNGTIANDMKIGENKQDFIESKSGVYRLGVMYQGALSGPLTRIQVVPVLFVDANHAGVYDTIIPDMSTSWEDYTRFDLKQGQRPDYDFDFTDETPVILGSGNEALTYDSDGDGRPDYSAGMIGARVLDVYSAIQNKTAKTTDQLRAVNGTLLEPLDPKGEYFGVMTDFQGHGTSSAASIVSKGIQEYRIYNDTRKFTITGVAPDAKIVPVKALWFGDILYGWLWTAGFENSGEEWSFSEPRVDIISNSWGVSTFPRTNSAPGLDLLSVIQSVLAVPRSLDPIYPGVINVNSAGNAGHGYGTLGLPSASPYSITVGATTNNVFVGYGPFKDQPRFGNTTDHKNHIVDFSSRGPGVIGDPKPDLVSIGAHSFTPTLVTQKEKESDREPFTMFGGTSMAAPLVAGAAALVIEELKNQGDEYDSFLVKNILMSTATDLKNDPLVQGSGMVNAEGAVDYVQKKPGTFLVSNKDSFENSKSLMQKSLTKVNSTSFGIKNIKFPEIPHPQTSWFAGHLLPGEKSITTFTIKNPSDQPLEIKVHPTKMRLIKQTTFNGTTEPRQKDPVLNKTDAFSPNYIRLSDIKGHRTLADYYETQDPIPEDSSLLVLNLNFAFSDFLNKTTDRYASDLEIASVYLYDWNDKNNKTIVSSDELSLVNRGGSWGTVQELRVSDPADKFNGTAMVGVYPVPTKFSYWAGNTKLNATALNYTATASYYKDGKWDEVWLSKNTVTVPPKGSSELIATITAPIDSQTGVYQGFLSFEGEKQRTKVPVTYVVKKEIKQKDSVVLLKSKQSNDVLFGNGYVRGAFDMTNRYMAGDWQSYYLDVRNPSINTATIDVSWKNNDTSVSLFVLNPEGRIVQTNVPAGVFGKFLNWPSTDWLGTSAFSQGGGFYPVKNKDQTSLGLYVPINQTGTYTLLMHNTLFGGNATTEPISVTSKFTTLEPDDKSPQIITTIPKVVGEGFVFYPDIRDENLYSVGMFIDGKGTDYTFANPINFTGLAEGSHKLRISAVDRAGNNSTKQFLFEKDTTAPSLTVHSPKNGTKVSGAVDISLDVNDPNLAQSGFLSVTLPNGTSIWDKTSLSLDAKSMAVGQNILDFEVQDSVGNKRSSSVTFVVEDAMSATGEISDSTTVTLMIGLAAGAAIGAVAMLVALQQRIRKSS